MIRNEIEKLEDLRCQLKGAIFWLLKRDINKELTKPLTREEKDRIQEIITWTIIGTADNLDLLKSETFEEYMQKTTHKTKSITYVEKAERIFK